MLKILFYAPHSAIWVHAFPEALIAEALQQQIHRIVYVTCGRQFKDYCAAMSGFGLSYDSPSAKKKKICDKCQTHGNIIKRNFNLTGYDLADKIKHNDIQSVYRVLQDVTKENFLDFEIDNVAVGRLALYQFCYAIGSLFITPCTLLIASVVKLLKIVASYHIFLHAGGNFVQPIANSHVW